jgi:hypothetical protein
LIKTGAIIISTIIVLINTIVVLITTETDIINTGIHLINITVALISAKLMFIQKGIHLITTTVVLNRLLVINEAADIQPHLRRCSLSKIKASCPILFPVEKGNSEDKSKTIFVIFAHISQFLLRPASKYWGEKGWVADCNCSIADEAPFTFIP